MREEVRSRTTHKRTTKVGPASSWSVERTERLDDGRRRLKTLWTVKTATGGATDRPANAPLLESGAVSAARCSVTALLGEGGRRHGRVGGWPRNRRCPPPATPLDHLQHRYTCDDDNHDAVVRVVFPYVLIIP